MTKLNNIQEAELLNEIIKETLANNPNFDRFEVTDDMLAKIEYYNDLHNFIDIHRYNGGNRLSHNKNTQLFINEGGFESIYKSEQSDNRKNRNEQINTKLNITRSYIFISVFIASLLINGLYLFGIIDWNTKNVLEKEKVALKNEKTEIQDSALTLKLDEINVYSLKTLESLTTTSGMLPISEYKDYCLTDSNEFLGTYTLIDKNVNRPFGLMVVRCSDNPNNWKFSTKNEELVSLKLTSDYLSLWDRIAVGMSEEELQDFIGKRFHYKKGQMIYSDFDKYEGVFWLDNGIIKKLEINLICKD